MGETSVLVRPGPVFWAYPSVLEHQSLLGRFYWQSARVLGNIRRTASTPDSVRDPGGPDVGQDGSDQWRGHRGTGGGLLVAALRLHLHGGRALGGPAARRARGRPARRLARGGRADGAAGRGPGAVAARARHAHGRRAGPAEGGDAGRGVRR